jgi:oxygen-independent coproporphyrinogen-3 oxidase
MLRVRLPEGLDADTLGEAGRAAVPGLVAAGWVDAKAAPHRVVLTRRGRLLADAVVRVLLGWEQAPVADGVVTSPSGC